MKKQVFVNNAQNKGLSDIKKSFSWRRILIAALLIFSFSLCKMPVYAIEEEVSNNVQTIEESSSTVEHNIVIDWPAGPLAVYQVDDPYRIESVAMLGDVYQGTISDSILNYLTGFIEPFQDYLIYRSGQYTYVVITGSDFDVSGSVLSGSGTVSTLTTLNDYNNTLYKLDQSERSFSVNTGGSAYVYSNQAGYSDILRSDRYEAFSTIGINAAFLFIAVRDIFRSIFR